MASVTPTGLGGGEVSTFSGLALDVMRRPVWPVMGSQNVGHVVGGRQSAGRQQVVLGGKVAMGGKAGKVSEEDVRADTAKKVSRETLVETVCVTPPPSRCEHLFAPTPTEEFVIFTSVMPSPSL